MTVNLKMMEDFCSANGISGFEQQATRVMKRYLEPVCDEIIYDKLGSIAGIQKGKEDGPVVMIAGHIDEVGFMLKDIDDNGYVKFAPIGGWNVQVLPNQLVTITTREGKEYDGIIGMPSRHEPEMRDKPVKITDLYIDLGVENKEEVERLGIQVGDMITCKNRFAVMNNENFLMAKAWDDRVGALIATEVLMNLKEEVGCRGGKTATHLIQPDIAFAVDVTVPCDIPEAKGVAKLGKGVNLCLMDHSHLRHQGLIHYMEKLAKELDIPYYYDMLTAGGTDSGSIHMSFDGIPTITLSLPCRYVHAHHSIIHKKDYENTVKLLTAFCKNLTWDIVEEIITSNR